MQRPVRNVSSLRGISLYNRLTCVTIRNARSGCQFVPGPHARLRRALAKAGLVGHNGRAESEMTGPVLRGNAPCFHGAFRSPHLKVLLISPTFTSLLPEDYGRPPLYEPIGLGYLAAITRERGFDVEVMDCYAEDWRNVKRIGRYTRIGMSEEAISERIRLAGPDVIGITFQFTGFDQDSKRIAALAKDVLPGVPIVVGGADASARSRDISVEPSVDVLVRGEGESSFLAVLEHYQKEGRIPNDLPGTTVKGSDNPPREEVEDVDSLPFPARDLLPMGVYLEDQFSLMPYAKRRPIGFMISSRGCPYNCVFCSTTKIWRRWRPRSPESVVDEIELLVREYGVREIAFQDDSFLVDPERVQRRACWAGRTPWAALSSR